MAAKANVAPGNASETRMDEGSGAPGSRISDDPPPLGRRLRAAFGFGAVANGVKNASLASYVTFYFNQVVGVDASVIGIAYAATLIVDAVADPLLGRWTDMARSRWGRRHPFMYFAALPTALFFYLLWFPPAGLSDFATGLWVFTLAGLARVSISAFEIASSAMAVELSDDYNQRTRLFSLRYLFGYIGAYGFSAVALSVIFKMTPEYPLGQLNPDSYSGFALCGALLIAIAILVCALGTHSRIPYLPQAEPQQERMRLGAHAREMATAFRNRGFLAIFGFGVCKYTATGAYSVMALYFATYLFKLTSAQMAILVLDSLVAAMLAAPLAPYFSNRIGKRASSMLFALGGVAVSLVPLLLIYFDLFFEPGDKRQIAALFVIGAVYGTMVTISLINTTAMLADVVEDSAVETGQRSAGVFFAASSFMQQCSTALGSLVASQILVGSGFPKKVDPDRVTEAMTDGLLLNYMPVSFGLWACGCVLLLFYPITRQRHEANVEQLRALRVAARAKEAGGAVVAAPPA